MRKIILNVAVSLDGFIEGPKGEFDWCFTDQDYGMKDFLGRIDTIFFGRKSYDVLLKMMDNPFLGKIKYVFSRTENSTEGEIQFINHDVIKEIRSIKNQSGKDIWLFGGAELTTTLVNCGLVDELQLAIHPLLLGQGKPLFENLKDKVGLTLMDTKTYSSGLVQLFFRIIGK